MRNSCKIRIPLPLNDGLAPDDIKSVMRVINHLNEAVDLKQEKPLDQDSCYSAEVGWALAQQESEPELKTTELSEAQKENKVAEIQQNMDVLPEFIIWLEKRIQSGNSNFV